MLEPYKHGYLKVTGGHEIYYELYGNPKGKPIIYLHGGPGGGTSPKDARFFDPHVWNVLLFDQRGSGKSTPFASVENNTTWDLVNDMNELLDKVGFEKVTLFGGSWGSTLSLVYAISHPKRVNGMILRGIWLSTQKEQDYFYKNMRQLRPELWERFMQLVPKNRRNDVSAFYLEQMLSPDPKISEKYAYEWAHYEVALMKLKSSPRKIATFLKDGIYKSLSPLEAHYFVNNCFLPTNFIPKNLHKIKNIPTSIVHGEYDLICPPSSAYTLHKKLRNSTLHMVHAGHSSSDPAIEKRLIKEVKRFENIV